MLTALRHSLQAQHRNLQSIADAPADPPRDLSKLPCILIWPGAARYRQDTMTGTAGQPVSYEGSITMQGEVYVSRVSNQLVPASAILKAESIHDEILMLYRVLAGDPEVLDVEGCEVYMSADDPLEVGAYGELEYLPGSSPYLGYRFVVRIECGLDT